MSDFFNKVAEEIAVDILSGVMEKTAEYEPEDYIALAKAKAGGMKDDYSKARAQNIENTRLMGPSSAELRNLGRTKKKWKDTSSSMADVAANLIRSKQQEEDFNPKNILEILKGTYGFGR